MKLAISTKQFPKLPKLLPRKGEKRLGFFKRQFKGQFTRDQMGELCKFIEEHGFRPMEPVWPGRGCYILAAVDVFENHPMRDRYVSALMLGDLVWAFPKLEPVLLDKIKLVLEERASRYKKEEKVNEKQIRLLIRNLQKRNRANHASIQKRTTKGSRHRDNEEA